MSALHEILRQRLTAICRREGLLGETVRVCAAPLSTEEAIGTPEDKDFPLQKGKERLLQATFRDARGQAFTDHYGNYEGTLESLLATPPENTFRRAVFVAALNAVSQASRTSETPSTVGTRIPAPARPNWLHNSGNDSAR
jgi:hypothetical protein